MAELQDPKVIREEGGSQHRKGFVRNGENLCVTTGSLEKHAGWYKSYNHLCRESFETFQKFQGNFSFFF